MCAQFTILWTCALLFAAASSDVVIDSRMMIAVVARILYILYCERTVRSVRTCERSGAFAHANGPERSSICKCANAPERSNVRTCRSVRSCASFYRPHSNWRKYISGCERVRMCERSGAFAHSNAPERSLPTSERSGAFAQANGPERSNAFASKRAKVWRNIFVFVCCEERASSVSPLFFECDICILFIVLVVCGGGYVPCYMCILL